MNEINPFQPPLRFDGPSLTKDDTARLYKQGWRVLNTMLDHDWHTLAEISQATGDPEASVSARLRDLRKPRFGAFLVERRRRTKGTWEYRVGEPDYDLEA